MEGLQPFFQETNKLELILNKVREKLYIDHVNSEELEKIQDVLRGVISDQKPYFNAIKKSLNTLGDTIKVLNEAFDVKH